MTSKRVVGRFIPEPLAEEIHRYLMSRPWIETNDLIVALRQSTPITRVLPEAKSA